MGHGRDQIGQRRHHQRQQEHHGGGTVDQMRPHGVEGLCGPPAHLPPEADDEHDSETGQYYGLQGAHRLPDARQTLTGGGNQEQGG